MSGAAGDGPEDELVTTWPGACTVVGAHVGVSPSQVPSFPAGTGVRGLPRLPPLQASGGDVPGQPASGSCPGELGQRPGAPGRVSVCPPPRCPRHCLGGPPLLGTSRAHRPVLSALSHSRLSGLL